MGGTFLMHVQTYPTNELHIQTTMNSGAQKKKVGQTLTHGVFYLFISRIISFKMITFKEW